MLSPYNNSIFKLRYEYKNIFKSIYLEDEKKQKLADKGKFDLGDEKVFKIKYQLNLLTSMSEKNGQIMNAIASSKEISIFQTDLIKDMIDYKWKAFAQSTHFFGATVHITYVIVLMYYIVQIFLNSVPTYHDKNGNTLNEPCGESENCIRVSPSTNETLLVIIAGCLVYPLFYDGTQAIKQGLDYLGDSWNYLDMSHIALGYYNIYLQYNDTWAL